MTAQDRYEKRMKKRLDQDRVGIHVAVSKETKHKRMLEIQADIVMKRSCADRKRGK